MSSITPHLKLRLSSDLTADSLYNLRRIDALGATHLLTRTAALRIRAKSSITVEPNSADLGGSGTGGTVQFGDADRELDAVDVYAPLRAHTALEARERTEVRAYETADEHYVGFRAPDVLAASQIWDLPEEDGSDGQVLVTDGAGALGWASILTTTLDEGRVDVGAPGSVRTAVDTASTGDISASYTTGLTYKAGSIENADISASAGIARNKLAAGTARRLVVNDASGLISDLSSLTASRALATDADGLPTASATTATELGYLSGVTSAIQTQIDARLPKAGGTMSGTLTLAGDPSSSLDAATKQYVDSLANGLKWKAAVRAASTANLTLSGEQTVDGVALVAGDRVLAKDQSTAADRGIYVVASGSWTRAADSDSAAELNSAVVMVSEGTANADKGFIQTATLSSLASSQTWTQNFGTGLYTADGQGIELSGSTFSLELDGSSLSKSASGLKVSNVALASMVSGTLAIGNGGTGQTSANAALNALLPTQTGNANKILKTDGTDAAWVAGATVVTTTAGDLIYRDASADTRLALGTKGKRLKAGTSAPEWSWQAVNTVSSANYTVTDTDGYELILVTTGASARTMTLPSAANNTGRRLTFKKVDTGAAALIVAGAGGTETIDGLTSVQVYFQHDVIDIVCDGTGWHYVGVHFQSAKATASSTGHNPAASNANFYFVRHGNVCTMTWPPFSVGATVGAGFFNFAAGTIPANFRPTVDLNVPVCTLEGNVNKTGGVVIDSDGSLQFGAASFDDTFNGVTANGSQGGSVSWTKY